MSEFLHTHFLLDGVPSSDYNIMLVKVNDKDFTRLPVHGKKTIFQTEYNRCEKPYYYFSKIGMIDVEFTFLNNVRCGADLYGSPLDAAAVRYLFGRRGYRAFRSYAVTPGENDLEYSIIFDSGVDFSTYDGSTGFFKVSAKASPYAVTSAKSITLRSGETAVIDNTSDIADIYDSYNVYPKYNISCAAGGTVSVTNQTENRTMIVTDCLPGEVIHADGGKHIIRSSFNRLLMNNWNKEFLYLRGGENNMTFSGDGQAEIVYSFPKLI